MKYLIYILFILNLFLLSCIKEPTAPDNIKMSESAPSSALILCEGNWGLDNSVLLRYDLEQSILNEDFYGLANPGFKLGDIANDIVIHDSIALIAVTTAKTIEVINANTGKSIGRIFYPQGSAPRRIAVVNDSIAAVTDLYRHTISFINFRSLKITADRIPVGPAPEGIAYFNGLLFVVNSGYGDYLADTPKAGTVSIVDADSKLEIGNFYAGPNPIEVLLNPQHNLLIVSFNNLPSKKDSVGGIIEYSLSDLREINRCRTEVRSLSLSPSGDSLVFISNRGVELININSNFTPINIIPRIKQSDIWYSVAYQNNGNIWVGNAFNHQISGEVEVYESGSTSPVKKFPVGVNPGKIIFYNRNQK